MSENKDYFLINNGAISYFYAPLKRCFFSFASEETENIKRYFIFENSEFIDEKIKDNIDKILLMEDSKIRNNITSFPGHLLFLLSEKCNLACSYCYAHDSHCNTELKVNDIKEYLDYFFSFRNKKRSISFLGGGEPFLSWNLIEYAVPYAKSKASQYKEYVHFGITTNLTILNPSMVDFIKDNHISINGSFDILPEIQDSQRMYANGQGTFFIANKNIKQLLDNGVFPHFRSTITPQNVKLMPEMVEYVAQNYPQIKKLHFEHVSDNNMQNAEEYYGDFINYFFKALEIAKINKIKLTNSIINSMLSLRTQFCSEEFCVTSTNSIVSCHRVSNENSPYFKAFQYGKKEKEIKMKAAFDERIRGIQKSCETCFAKYNCGGGCAYNRFYLATEKFEIYCDFVRKMMLECFRRMLLE